MERLNHTSELIHWYFFMNMTIHTIHDSTPFYKVSYDDGGYEEYVEAEVRAIECVEFLVDSVNRRRVRRKFHREPQMPVTTVITTAFT